MILMGAALAACSDDSTSSSGDAGGDATVDDGGDMEGDGGGDMTGDMGDPVVERGRYLVENVLACADCHTPRTETGAFDMTRWLAGVPNFADLDPEDDSVGAINTANLTPHATGLGDWTDLEIRTALTQGLYPAAGRHSAAGALFPIMPYFLFGQMTDDDLTSIIAYLRSIDPVDNPITERQDLGFPFDQPGQPLMESQVPQTTLAAGDPDYEAAQHGRYLASLICIDCHTTEDPDGPVPIDVDRLFLGGRAFPAADVGLPSPPFPEQIISRNLTPDATGLQGWTPQQIAAAVRTGIDIEGEGLCPPMPVGPNGPFGGMTEEDALAIGTYLTTLPPVETDDYPQCMAPTQ